MLMQDIDQAFPSLQPFPLVAAVVAAVGHAAQVPVHNYDCLI